MDGIGYPSSDKANVQLHGLPAFLFALKIGGLGWKTAQLEKHVYNVTTHQVYTDQKDSLHSPCISHKMDLRTHQLFSSPPRSRGIIEYLQLAV